MSDALHVYSFIQNDDLGSWPVFEAANSLEEAFKAIREFEPNADYQYVIAMAKDKTPEEFLENFYAFSGLPPYPNDMPRLMAAYDKTLGSVI